VPQANSGLMRPAVDAHGDIWFGEMNTNRLGRLNPRTDKIDVWTPPHADYGIMGIAIDAQNHVWFAEQNTGLIGEFFPTTETFKVFPTTPRTRDHGPSGPQDLVFDQEDQLWFTELSADRIGRLDVTTGTLQEYPVPEAAQNALAAPYGIAVDQQGDVWFSEVSGPSLVRLDPRTGAMHTYSLPGAQSGMMEVVTAPDGSIWCAAYLNGNLVQFDPKTDTTHAYAVPALVAGTQATGIYGLAVGATGDLWFTDIGDNAIGHVQPATGRFTFYPIPTANSGPFGLVIDQSRRVWFTEGSAAGNAIGMVPATAPRQSTSSREAHICIYWPFSSSGGATTVRIVSAHPRRPVEDGAAALGRSTRATGTRQ
jgi:virginiamycin B lyase